MTTHATPLEHSSPDDPANGRRPIRRRMLQWIGVLLAALAASAAGIPIVGFVLSALVRRKKDQWVELGQAAQVPLRQTRIAQFDNPDRQPWDGTSARIAVYVRRLTEDEFVVFAVNCTHLGCPVTWFPEAGLFMCPCHGGVYYADGQRASGPPPRGLFRYASEVRDGRLWILAGHLPTLHDPASAESAEELDTGEGDT